ncbi:MAG TPA: hypothetical protein VH601_13435 [Bryobacteraceae bacterium]|jgi:hypothetical protein
MFTSDRRRSGRQDHVSEEDVLRFADGELDARRTATIRGHFETCWGCRTRLIDFQNTIANFVHFHEKISEQAIPPIAGPLAQLKARLGVQEVGSGVKRRHDFSARMFSLSAAAVLILLLVITFLRHSDRGVSTITRPYPAEPLASLTPGQAVPISRQQVCSSDSQTRARVPAPILRKRVFAEYGMANAQEQDFEVDFLITPELGGAETVKNLWPEPYYNTVWNAHVKDQLEVRLRDLVCSGELDLGTAQRDLSSGWIAAYRRYFKSEMPIRKQTPVALLLAMFEQP